jgi:hypothetical protein
MLPAGFEPAILASVRPQAHTLDGAVTAIGKIYYCKLIHYFHLILTDHIYTVIIT